MFLWLQWKVYAPFYDGRPFGLIGLRGHIHGPTKHANERQKRPKSENKLISVDKFMVGRPIAVVFPL